MGIEMPRTQEGFNDYMAAELRTADLRMDELVGKVNAIEQDQAAAKALLKENTEAINAIKSDTADMLATFESWRGAMRVLEAIGRLARPVSYIVGLVASIAAFYTAVKSGVGTK